MTPDILRSKLAFDVRRGLTSEPRTLPPHIFYDRAGTLLFEQICHLPEYYVTKAERDIFVQWADQMVDAFQRVEHVIELGAGSAAKTGILLKSLIGRWPSAKYHPVDVSLEALRIAVASLELAMPMLRTCPHEGFYGEALHSLIHLEGRKLVMFIGSSIGNFEPREATAFLRDVRSSLKVGDILLLGADLPKSPSILIPAYDDPKGITAAFNKNALERINREWGANFAPELFEHVALWNKRESRIEMHLESRNFQQVSIPGLDLQLGFEPGDRIHTENSYKYSQERLRHMLRITGFQVVADWRDRNGYFADWLAQAV